MSNVIDLFGIDDTLAVANPYHNIGYPRNPFRENDDDQKNMTGAFYKSHIESQLKQVNTWINDVHNMGIRQPLSLVGNIGTGKTRLLRFVRSGLLKQPPSAKIFCDLLILSQTGYARASLGGLLVAALERMEAPDHTSIPQNVLPLVWMIVTAENFPMISGPLAEALRRAHKASGSKREELARICSQWLQRSSLTVKQSEETGLRRKIDWEGEVITVFADLLRVAQGAGVLKTFFLFVDQLEDLFRPDFSELRRSRILTDLRGLIDEIDNGAPIGLLLSWSPEFNAATLSSNLVEREFRSKYEALYSRTERNRINLPLLADTDAFPFAKAWIDSVQEEKPFDLAKQPNPLELAGKAWADLQRERKLLPGNKATPRDLLTALAREVNRRAGVSDL